MTIHSMPTNANYRAHYDAIFRKPKPEDDGVKIEKIMLGGHEVTVVSDPRMRPDEPPYFLGGAAIDEFLRGK